MIDRIAGQRFRGTGACGQLARERVVPELQRFVWEWESLIVRLRKDHPRVADLLARSTRPIAADRRPDGRILLVLGCWVPADRTWLQEPNNLLYLEESLAGLLEERIALLVTEWPSGDGTPDAPPDPFQGLSEAIRAAGVGCGGVFKRAFFAAAARRGIVFECGYPVLNYRLDFALPRQRLGVEIEGWNWRAWARPGAAERREREQSLGYEGWTVLWFTGEEILRHLDDAMEAVARALGARKGR